MLMSARARGLGRVARAVDLGPVAHPWPITGIQVNCRS